VSARAELRRGHLVVGAWTAGNGVLAGLLLGFHPSPIEIGLYAGAVLLVSAFGLAVLHAVRTGRGVGTTVRMPVRSTAAVLTAIGLTLAGLALPYGPLWLVVALYPLIAAAVLVRGERLPADTRPWPASLDGMPLAEPHPARRPLVHHGETLGDAVAVPPDHPAHVPAPPRRRSRLLVLLLVVPGAVRALVDLITRRRRGRGEDR
jgi:hypothetical protein